MKRNGLFAKACCLLFAAFMLAPIIVVIGVSFTPTGFLEFPPSGISLRWFHAILDNPQFIHAAWISLQLGLASATLATLLGVPAALAIGRGSFKGRDVLLAIFMSPLMVPTVVLGIAFLRFLTLAGLNGTFTGLVLCHVVVITPFVLRLVLASVVGLDASTERAAIAMGASDLTVFRRVTLPTILPGIVGGWMLAFISFDELTVTVFIASPSTTTLPVRMFSHIAQTTDPLIASVSTVVIVFTVILMVLIDRLYGLDRLLIGEGKR